MFIIKREPALQARARFRDTIALWTVLQTKLTQIFLHQLRKIQPSSSHLKLIPLNSQKSHPDHKFHLRSVRKCIQSLQGKLFPSESDSIKRSRQPPLHLDFCTSSSSKTSKGRGCCRMTEAFIKPTVELSYSFINSSCTNLSLSHPSASPSSMSQFQHLTKITRPNACLSLQIHPAIS